MSSISSNQQSLIAQSFLNKNRNAFQTSLERLSSGLRVNNSRDDASGLSVATRLDAQARAYDIFQRNANDAVSYMQIADGALSNISDNLLRMDELRVQASSAFLTNKDRAALDKEYQELIDENDRIIENTEYNGIKIFGVGRELLTTKLGNENVSFDLSASLSLEGRGTKGALQAIFNTAGIGSTPESLNISNGAVLDFVSGNTGTYNVNVAQLARSFQYRDTVGAGPFGIAANVLNSNMAVAGYLAGPPGTYNVNVATVASNYVYTDAVGAGNPNQGINAASFAATNSNPAVATITAADDSNAQYSLQVNTIAQGQVNTITGVAATNGSADTNGGFVNGDSFNRFRITFGDGSTVNFNVNGGGGAARGTYTTAAYVAAFNAASGGRVTAAYNAGTGTLTYTQNSTGTNNSFTLENRSATAGIVDNEQGAGSFAPADIFETNAGNTTVAAQNATGNLNGQAFTSQTNNAITVNAAGDAGRTATFNVLSAGTTNFDERNATVNRFAIAFGDGTPGVTLNLGSGVYSAMDFVNAFNASAAGAKFQASYDMVSGNITYTGLEDGANETLNITNTSTQNDDGVNGAFAPSDVYNVGAAQITATGTNFTGTVNGTAFNSATGSGLTVAGLTFNALSLGNSTIQVIQASVNQFDVDFGDGSSFTLNLGTGLFSATDFVNQFNAQAAGKYTAAYDGNNITYTSLVSGSVNSLSVVNLGTASNNVFNTADAAVIQSGQNTTGDVNGVAFSSTTTTVSTPDLTFLAKAPGSTTIDYVAEEAGEVDFRFIDIKTVMNARDETDNLRVATNAITSLRAKVGANINRLDATIQNSQIAGAAYFEAMGRILDADFAKESLDYTRQLILQQGAISVLSLSNASNSRVLDLIGTGLQQE